MKTISYEGKHMSVVDAYLNTEEIPICAKVRVASAAGEIICEDYGEAPMKEAMDLARADRLEIDEEEQIYTIYLAKEETA